MSRRQPVDFGSWGSVKLPIYFSPLKVKVPTEGATGNGGNGARALKSVDAVKTYDSFVFYYYERGTRRKGRGPTLERAKAKAKNIAKRLAQEGDQTIELSQAERRVYVNARSILASHDLEVDSGARLLHDLLVRLNGASLQQAVDFFNAHGKDVLSGVKMEEILDAYMEDLERRGVGHHHKRDVTKFIGGFVRAFPSEPAVVHTKQIDLWLGQSGGKARNKNNARDKVIAFFNFMEQKGYLPKGGADVAKRATPFHDPRPVITCEEDAAASAHDNDIYTPEELSRILEVSEPDERLTIELKAFSGLRSEELARLWWVLVNEKARYINITDAIAKVNQRAVPIFDNLQRRLAAYPEAEKRDRVCKRWTSSNALYHVWKRVTDRAGLPYKKNGFRNSYISYRLAQTKDINLVAYESGNSPEMIRKYYLDLVTPEQAAAWFAL